MAERTDLLQSIATTIADYRAGEIPTPTIAHVQEWVKQFDTSVQLPILKELNHVLDKTYIPRTEVEKFLAAVSRHPKLAGSEPREYWKQVNFLHLQEVGNSQRDMLQMFDSTLQQTVQLRVADCGSSGGPFVYLDDAVFTGGRVRSDLVNWIRTDAPTKAEVHIIVIAYHQGGQYYAQTKINEAAKANRKSIHVTWWRVLEIEDRRHYINNSDVLRPTIIPDDAATVAYAESLDYTPVLRQGVSLGQNGFFSSAEGRHVLEQELLKAGVHIRELSPYLNQYQRPLGNVVLQTLGFGALLVTFRNCPNNCPLAFWAGDPWYPLFPRRTN